MQLVFEMRSYWLAGTGNDAGAYADNLAAKDRNALPYLPAKTQKGQIREAFQLAEDNAWFSEFNQHFDTKLTDILFGIESRDVLNGQGVLQFSNAELSDNEKAFFLTPETERKRRQRINCLFALLNSTAIDAKGNAKLHSLRSYEVVVPMTLLGELFTQTQHLDPEISKVIEQNLPVWFDQVLPLITHIGAKKQRGLGEVIVTLARQKEA